MIGFLLLICTSGYHSKAKRNNYLQTVHSASSFQTGDIILRESNGFLAAVFKSFSLKEKKYSHAGFILKEDAGYFVCHFIDGSTSGYIKVKLDDFISTDECSSYAIYRPSYSAKQQQCINDCINDPLNKQLQFDDRFELKSNKSLYCTEWIYKCLLKAGFVIPTTKVNSIEYIAPDNLYINNFTKIITYVEYSSEI